MPTKGINHERLHKLNAMLDSPSRAEAIAAFGLVLDELAKEQDARFSVEYNIGTPHAEEAAEEMATLRAELAEALESVVRHETTTKELGETIDRLHESMKEIDDHFQPDEPPPPPPVQPLPVHQPPVMPFADWGTGNNDLTLDTPQPRIVHSGPFPWKTLGAWAYGFAAVFWMALVCLPDWGHSYSNLFLPLLWILTGVPAFLYLRKVREDYGWIGVAVKVCLTAEILVGLALLLWFVHWREMPAFTRREQVFSFIVLFGLLWFLWSERFFLWVLDERKRTQFIVFPGGAFILVWMMAWVTASDTKAVKAAVPPPHIRKHHPAPKPTPSPDDPQKLNYDFELPSRNLSAPVLLETSYAPATDRPHLVAVAFQTSTSSADLSGGVVLYLLALVAFAFLKLVSGGESKAQKQKRYQKALDEANAPLPQNETGNAGHASAKDLKKRGWA